MSYLKSERFRILRGAMNLLREPHIMMSHPALYFGGIFRFDVDHPKSPNNDRLIFSKGHASPLFYALWAAAGELSEEDLLTYRTFGSPLEGHPTVAFR
jgi:transketolase